MHRNSELLFEKYAKTYFSPQMKVLEIGPSSFPTPFQKMINNLDLTWHTLDIKEYRKLTYSNVNEHEYPIPDESYDIIIAGQVIEHVRKIWLWIKELSRIVKYQGHIIIIGPLSWPYHPAPVDCWRIFPEGMKALFEESNLKIELCKVESIEGSKFKKIIPGKGLDWQNKLKVTISKALAPLGFPVEVAFDVITIAKK